MGRSITLITSLAVIAAACGGDDGGGTQPQTEEAALEATVDAMQQTMRGSADAVLNFMTDECRAETDEEEVRLGLLLLAGFLQSDDFDIDDVTVVGEIESFDGDSATVAISYELPEGVETDGFFFDSSDVDVVYQGGRWRAADCDTDDSGDSGFGGDPDEELEEELAALGLSGTQSDPLGFGTAAPIGGGFEVVFTSWDPDAVERYNTANDTTYLLDDGEQMAFVEYSILYRGTAEPASLSDAQIQLVGSTAVELNSIGCSALGGDPFLSGRQMFSGGVFQGAECFTGTAAELDGALIAAAGSWFQDRKVFFDPSVSVADPEVLAGTSGPSPDGSQTEGRTSPAPLGTAIDVDDDWTVQINSFEPDVTEQILAADTFADPPAAGQSYALLNVTYSYAGDESSSVSSISTGLIGDSNVGSSDCGFVDVPDPIDTFSDVFNGASLTGNLCFVIESAEADSMVAWFRSFADFDDQLSFAAIR